MGENPLLSPTFVKVDPLESGIEFFQEQKKFTFLLRYQCNKVFINHIDSFNGRHIMRYIGCREYVEATDYQELDGEEGRHSVPTMVDQPFTATSLTTSIKSSGVDTDGQAPLRDDAAIVEESRPLISEVMKVQQEEETLGPGETIKDSLVSLLGGLLTEEQVAVLRSLPNRMLRAQYLQNILKQVEPELELPAEESETKITGYDISGTLKYCDECLPEIQIYLKEKVKDLKAYLPTLLTCATVIFDISRDPSQIEEATWALRAILCSFQYLEKKSMLCFNKIKDVRKFILISSAMTWANTDKMKIRKKTVTEENLPLRKPHPLFKEHKHLEQEVIRAGLKYPEIFKTYVLASGIPYGYEEDRLHYLFDLGWKNEEELPLLGDGHNSLPVIHVEDLAMLVFHCMVRVDITPSYFFAAEKNPPTLLQITEGVSKGLTTGKTSVYPIDQPLPLNINIHEDTYAMLTSELLLEPTIHKLDLPWKYSMNMVHNMAAIVDEYIEYRNLCSFKIILGGPPACGKTKIAERIAQIYDLKYVSVEETVKNYVEKLEKEAEAAKADISLKPEGEGENDRDDDADDDDEYVKDEEGMTSADSRPVYRNELEEIKHSMNLNNGLPDDHIVIRILKKRLEEKDILNHGYVLDGWPETSPQAYGLFGKEEEEEMPTPEMSEEEDEADVSDEEFLGEQGQTEEIKTRNVNIQPNYLIQLDCDCDEVLFKILSEKQDLERLQMSSIKLANRMEQYRDIEKLGCRAFDFFDNKCLELKILRYKVSSDPCPFLGKTLKHILDSLGPPTNKGFVRRYLKEYKMIRRIQADENEKKNKERADGIEKMDVLYFRAACRFMDTWINFKDNVINESSECGGLEDELLPQNVVDTAVKALINFKQTSPDDHLEFLAEFFLEEYEREKGRSRVTESQVDGSLALRRCVATVLERCDLACLHLLPQAVDIIMKYRRLAEAKGSVFPPTSCQLDVQERERTTISEKDGESQADNMSERSSKSSIFGFKTEVERTLSPKSLGQISLNKLVELLLKTDPIWKDKPCGEWTGKKLALSDDSLKVLLEQLKQLSCEIRYRLKKRGIQELDDESKLGSCGEWPRQGPVQECSGEIRTHHPSQPSLDMKNQLEQLKKRSSRGSNVDSSNLSSPPSITHSNSSSIKTSHISKSKVESKSFQQHHVDKKPSIEPSNDI